MASWFSFQVEFTTNLPTTPYGTSSYQNSSRTLKYVHGKTSRLVVEASCGRSQAKADTRKSVQDPCRRKKHTFRVVEEDLLSSGNTDLGREHVTRRGLYIDAERVNGQPVSLKTKSSTVIRVLSNSLARSATVCESHPEGKNIFAHLLTSNPPLSNTHNSNDEVTDAEDLVHSLVNIEEESAYSLAVSSRSKTTPASPGLLDFLNCLGNLQRTKATANPQALSPPRGRLLLFDGVPTTIQVVEEVATNNMHQNPFYHHRAVLSVDEIFAEPNTRAFPQAREQNNGKPQMSVTYVPNVPAIDKKNINGSVIRPQIMFDGPPPPICPPIPHNPLPADNRAELHEKLVYEAKYIGRKENIREYAQGVKEQQRRHNDREENLQESVLFKRIPSADENLKRDKLLHQWKSELPRYRRSNLLVDSTRAQRGYNQIRSDNRQDGFLAPYLPSLYSSPTKSKHCSLTAQDRADNVVMDSFEMSPTLGGISVVSPSLSASFDDLSSDQV